MAIIDPVGFLCGERIGSCSDEAQFHWPRLVAASNSFGRIELSYESIIATVYRSIKKPPSPDKLASLLAEYRDKFLLFVYSTDKGETWGEWMIPDHLKSKYHTAADKRSPAPPKEALEAYRQQYVKSVKNKSNRFNDILKPLLNLPILEVNPEISKTTAVVNVVVVDDVIVNGKGKTTASSDEKPSLPATPPDHFIALPLNTGKLFGVTEEMVSRWTALFPAIDVRQQLRNMRAWTDANPRNRKTPAGIERFITGWLSKEQNRAPSLISTTKGSQYENKWDRVEREALAGLAGEEAADDG